MFAACRHRGPYATRRGLTLVELLVVIIILTTLVSAAIPLMAPRTETRQLREAARQLSTLISSAQSRAVQLERPVGIWLEKASADRYREEVINSISTGIAPQAGQLGDSENAAVFNVYVCEEPPPFSGFFASSAVRLYPDPLIPARFNCEFVRLDGGQYVVEELPGNMFRPGDEIHIDGTIYTLIVGPSAVLNGDYFVQSSTLPCAILNPLLASGRRWPVDPTNTQRTPPLRYTIRRLPQKGAGEPLQFPDGIAIDLEASGIGNDALFHNANFPVNTADRIPDNRDPVIIMFNPNGTMQKVIANFAGPNDPLITAPLLSTVYLHIGRFENIDQADPNTGEIEKVNWLDPETLWVTVSSSTGRVMTFENNVPTNLAGDRDDVGAWRTMIDGDGPGPLEGGARNFAQSTQGMTGR